MLVRFFVLRARLRVRPAPGIPCALYFEGTDGNITRAKTRRENASGCLTVESRFQFVMAGHSRSKNGVASARLCPAIHVFAPVAKKSVDARLKAGHDEGG
jgi:hypothetical protein